MLGPLEKSRPWVQSGLQLKWTIILVCLKFKGCICYLTNHCPLGLRFYFNSSAKVGSSQGTTSSKDVQESQEVQEERFIWRLSLVLYPCVWPIIYIPFSLLCIPILLIHKIIIFLGNGTFQMVYTSFKSLGLPLT